MGLNHGETASAYRCSSGTICAGWVLGIKYGEFRTQKINVSKYPGCHTAYATLRSENVICATRVA